MELYPNELQQKYEYIVDEYIPSQDFEHFQGLEGYLNFVAAHGARVVMVEVVGQITRLIIERPIGKVVPRQGNMRASGGCEL